jgi:hypothetical protein
MTGFDFSTRFGAIGRSAEALQDTRATTLRTVAHGVAFGV